MRRGRGHGRGRGVFVEYKVQSKVKSKVESEGWRLKTAAQGAKMVPPQKFVGANPPQIFLLIMPGGPSPPA